MNATKISLLAAALLLSACTHRAHQARNGDEKWAGETYPTTEIAMQNNAFAFDLMQQIPWEDDNVVISPFSISTALAMTYAGARGNTRDQMASVMRFSRDQERFHPSFANYMQSLKDRAEGKIELNIANSLWAQEDYHFLDTFFETVERFYHSETFQVNFVTNREQVRQDINQWVFVETGENIEDLIAPGVFTDDTRLVLVNAIHFLGAWLKEFDKELTRRDNFHLRDGERVQTDFMFRNDTLPYYQSDDLQALQIPYAGKDFSMLLVLPAEGISLEELSTRLDAEGFAELNQQLQEMELQVIVPPFKARTKTDLEEVLMGMGMVEPFNRFADFSGMTGDEDLKIDKVIHEAMIEVGEEGTEAAAATAVVIIRKTAIGPEPTIFNANRPFLFFLKDNEDHSILFTGRVMNPAQ